MTELRTLSTALRQGVAYPLAHHRPYVGGRNLVMQSQDQAVWIGDFCLIAVAGGQIILTGPRRPSGTGPAPTIRQGCGSPGMTVPHT